ncbi:MAG: hypothetical protein KatS3mg085_809 [Candidatus Dojkabacteria bacterium]|nr:MAG: hypothetical protein KatS3mg085_809 [Candidatus Dojkabacteria bacterium]
MEKVSAKAKFVRVSPQKAKIIADILRGMNALEALEILPFMYKKAAKDFYKLVKSAVANATNNYGLDASKLKIVEIRVDKGIVLKRYKAGGRGSYKPFKRPTSHLSIVLGGSDAQALSQKEVDNKQAEKKENDKSEKSKKESTSTVKVKKEKKSEAKKKVKTSTKSKKDVSKKSVKKTGSDTSKANK